MFRSLSSVLLQYRRRFCSRTCEACSLPSAIPWLLLAEAHRLALLSTPLETCLHAVTVPPGENRRWLQRYRWRQDYRWAADLASVARQNSSSFSRKLDQSSLGSIGSFVNI